MALNQQFLQLMAWLKEQGHLDAGRKVVEVGQQQLNDAFLRAKEDIGQICRLFGVAPPSLPGPLAADGNRMLNPNAPYARAFYEALGYAYAYVDIDAPGGYPRDLNFDSVPAHLVGQHHLVTNFGTTEHVTNQLDAFKIINDLAAAGGIMIHELPSHGEVNHGFFAYQPKFFDRLAYSNGYDVLFFDFRWYEVEYGLHDDIQRLTSRFVDTKQRPRFGASPSSVAVVLRKTRDAASSRHWTCPTARRPPTKRSRTATGSPSRPARKAPSSCTRRNRACAMRCCGCHTCPRHCNGSPICAIRCTGCVVRSGYEVSPEITRGTVTPTSNCARRAGAPAPPADALLRETTRENRRSARRLQDSRTGLGQGRAFP